MKEKKKTIENRAEKQFLDTNQKSITSFFSKDFLNEEARYELNKIVEIEIKLNRGDLIYKTSNKKRIKHDCQKFKTIISFGREIYNDNLSLDDALKQKIRLKDDIDIFKESAKPKYQSKKKKNTNS